MKYAIGGSEGDFEPGSDNKVLKNRLGITVEQDMVDAEDDLLFQLYEYVFDAEKTLAVINFQVIQDWHRLWLGNIYDWAGEIRTVNLSKGGFQFTGAPYIPKQIASFEQGFLAKFADLGNYSEEALIRFLTQCHVEFILIHPFRDGNGRISRLLLDVMFTQAGFGPLDYTLMEQHKEYYFKSIQAGVGQDYEPLNRLLADIFKQSNV